MRRKRLWNRNQDKVRGGGGSSTSDDDASGIDNKHAQSVYRKGITEVDNNIYYLLKHHETYHKHTMHFRPNIMGRFLPYRRSIGSPLCMMDHRVFCGMFSKSGNTYMTASQDSCIRLYDVSRLMQWSSRYHPQRLSREETTASLPLYRTIHCRDVSWSVISTDFSPDEKWVAYSSWSRFVHLCNTSGPHEIHEPHNFSPSSEEELLCLFSIQFSPRSTHILGGGSDHRVYLYSLELKKVVLCLEQHTADVNATVYLDETGQTFISGSDDSLIKVWDERDSRMKAVGTLVGHGSGITCLSAKDDGRYIISNSKDQTLKLWDVRCMSENNGVEVKKALKRGYRFDYRNWNIVPEYVIHNVGAARHNPSGVGFDSSISTFYGHSVLQTLIRCRFSPMHTTGQRYVYSGSKCGRIFIWDTVSGSRVVGDGSHMNVVRDVSWHPHAPILASASWDGTVGLWENGSTHFPRLMMPTVKS